MKFVAPMVTRGPIASLYFFFPEKFGRECHQVRDRLQNESPEHGAFGTMVNVLRQEIYWYTVLDTEVRE